MFRHLVLILLILSAACSSGTRETLDGPPGGQGQTGEPTTPSQETATSGQEAPQRGPAAPLPPGGEIPPTGGPTPPTNTGTEPTPPCLPEDNLTFCTRLGKNCGVLSGINNCGAQVMRECGSCEIPQFCGGGGIPNVCGGSCFPEDSATFCSRLGKDCGVVSAPNNCGQIRSHNCGTCPGGLTCGGSGIDHVCGTPPAPAPDLTALKLGNFQESSQRWSHLFPSPGRKVIGMEIDLMTGPFPNNGTDASFFFTLCPTNDFSASSSCFRCRLSGNGNATDTEGLRLDPGAYETIDLFLEGGKCPTMPGWKKPSGLQYPDDFKFFSITVDTSSTPPDDWMLAGIEIRYRTASEAAPRVAYRNPGLNRLISPAWSPAWPNARAIQSILEDDTFCFYIETEDCTVGCYGDEMTNDILSIHIPLRTALDPWTEPWIQSAKSLWVPSLQLDKLANEIVIDLHWGWDGLPDDYYNDFEMARKTSYCVTCPHCQNRLEEMFQIRISGSDYWGAKRIRAYHMRPGDPALLSRQECLFAEVFNPQGLSMSPSPTNTGAIGIPAWPPEDLYQELTLHNSCSEFDSIRWGSGQDGPFAFGRR